MVVAQEEIIEPVITGTLNVVEVAADAGVRRVVLSSTIGTMYMDPRRDPDSPLDDSFWSDLDYCKNTKVCTPTLHFLSPFSRNEYIYFFQSPFLAKIYLFFVNPQYLQRWDFFFFFCNPHTSID
jgi:hypothetical protein